MRVNGVWQVSWFAETKDFPIIFLAQGVGCSIHHLAKEKSVSSSIKKRSSDTAREEIFSGILGCRNWYKLTN